MKSCQYANTRWHKKSSYLFGSKKWRVCVINKIFLFNAYFVFVMKKNVDLFHENFLLYSIWRSVAMKIQYPDLATSVSSDVKNVVGVLKVCNIFQEEMFIGNIAEVAKW